MATGVFSLHKVYIRQNENIVNRNFASWPESSTYGYVCGGSIPGYSTLVNRLDYSIEITTLPGKNLPAIRSFGAGVSSLSYGYMGGGFNPTPTFFSQITRLDFSTETVSEPGKNLPFSRLYSGSVSSNNYGYFSAGSNSSLTAISTIARIDYSSETIDQPASRNLPANNAGHSSLISSNYGYFAGGFTPTIICTISRLDFVSDTCTVLSNPTGMPARAYSKGISNVSYGYFGGGYTPGSPSLYFSEISRLDFATEVSSVSSSRNLPVNINPAGTVGNINFGYFCGGETASTPVRTSAVTRLDFSTDTLNPTSAGLPTSLLGGMTFSGGQSIFRGSNTYGYYVGGFTPPAPTPTLGNCVISRLDFSSETFSDRTPYPSKIYRQKSISSNYYGYFGGGYINGNASSNLIKRFDFSNETITSSKNNLPLSIFHSHSGFSNSSYGYFGGGYSGTSVPTPQTCKIVRLDFSSETVSEPGKNLSYVTAYHSGFSSRSYGYFCGGYTSGSSINTVSRLDFSSETVSQPNKNISSPLYGATQFSNNIQGYIVGGYDTGFLNQVSKFDFSNENVSSGTNLPAGRSFAAATSSNFYGYLAGGQGSPTTPPVLPTSWHSTVMRIDFSTDSFNVPAVSLPSRRSSHDGISNSN
jgi:hypothetical protein